jgi:hypothetical protein
MKRIMFLLLIGLFVSCAEKEDDNPVSLDITYSEWYLTRTNSGGGMVTLKIEGSANADKVTVRTYGDGLISDTNVELDSKKNFSKEIVISFSATSVQPGEFEVTTLVRAHKGTDTLELTLKSGKLKY